MRIYFFIFYFFLSFFVFSQVTTIEGNFKSAQGKWLRLYAVQDFITYSDTLLAKTKIDSSGNFLINIKVPKTKVYYAYFKVNDLRSNDLYIEEIKILYRFDSLNFEILDTYTSFLTSLVFILNYRMLILMI